VVNAAPKAPSIALLDRHGNAYFHNNWLPMSYYHQNPYLHRADPTLSVPEYQAPVLLLACYHISSYGMMLFMMTVYQEPVQMKLLSFKHVGITS
jgi:hypothetical protein